MKLFVFYIIQVRALFDDKGKRVHEAGPSIPVQVCFLLSYLLFFPPTRPINSYQLQFVLDFLLRGHGLTIGRSGSSCNFVEVYFSHSLEVAISDFFRW